MTVVLVVVNVVVLVLGIVLLILGALIAWGQSFLYNILQPALATISNSGIYTTSSDVDPIKVTNYILDLLKYVGWPVFLIGIIIVAIAICGIVGGCCGLRILLLIYVIVNFAITVALVALCIAFYAADEQIDNFAKKYLLETLYKYTGENATNVETVLWTLMNAGVKCCGVNGGSDFTNATQWPRTYTYNGQSYNITYPYSCCKLDGNFKAIDSSCPMTHNTTNSNYMTGCFSEIRRTVKGYSYVGLGVTVGIIVLEIILMLFAACVCQAASKVIPGT